MNLLISPLLGNSTANLSIDQDPFSLREVRVSLPEGADFLALANLFRQGRAVSATSTLGC